METYQEYKDFVLACPSTHAPVVIEKTKSGKDKKPKKIDECPCKNDIGPSIPGYFSKDNVKLLFVLDAPTPRTVQEGIAWTGKDEEKVINWIKKAGLYGNNQVGFTYLSKCPASGFRSLSKNYKYCKSHLKNELELANNPALMIVGWTAAKVMLPTAVAPHDETHYQYSFVGYDMNLFGTQYFFLSDLTYIYTGRDEVRSQGDYLLNIASIKKAANILNISLQK